MRGYYYFGMGLMGFCFFIAILGTFADTKIELTDCYDEHNNKIVELQCEEHVPEGEWSKFLYGIMPYLSLLAIISVFVILIGITVGN